MHVDVIDFTVSHKGTNHVYIPACDDCDMTHTQVIHSQCFKIRQNALLSFFVLGQFYAFGFKF